ncbi:DUF4040 family protein [Kocuria sp. cx-455]|uniref:DUF4040 family protein n=1 Tax=Kocuria sp. cx-455 TaxID=2771377 RepID=UPI003D708D7D
MLLTCLILALLTCVASPLITKVLGRNAGWVLALPLLGAALLATSAFADAARSGSADSSGSPVVAQWVPWMPTVDVGLGLRLDGLALVFTLLVLVIGALIMVYSTRYLEPGGKHGTFYLLMTGFAAAMLALVLADDLIVLYVAWEATTLCSFFLIARSGAGAREPAIRTLLVTVAGGLLLLAAVTVMIIATGTTRLSEILVDPVWSVNGALTTSVAVLIALAAFTKSAQFPFQAWLPDSMVAITPVSAYLHAAAMVKAGIYLLLRFSPVFADVSVWNVMLVTAGLVTALFGAIAALRRYDLKELLAYSTMSQLGLLVTMIGIGTPEALKAAVIHTIAHALFKSALFMIIGVIDHSAHTRDIRELAPVRLRMPVTATAMGLAAASMAGVPPLLGFVSKETMLKAFLDAPGPVWVPWVVTAAAAVASIFTFAYSARLVLGAFGGRADRSKDSHHVVREVSPAFWGAPALGAASGLVLGVTPFLLDELVTVGATAAAGEEVAAHFALWHGLVPELFVSLTVIALGTVLVLARHRVHRAMEPYDFPMSGLDVVDTAREQTIRLGGVVGGWTGSIAPRRHLSIPAVALIAIAAIAVLTIDDLPAVVDDPSDPLDWVLVVLIACGVVAMMQAKTLIAAIVVTGVVGFGMTVWFLQLGATDVAITQLLVEILTVCVMVLLLRRLPTTFEKTPPRKHVLPLLVAGGAGLATTVGVWALTGRREMSPASEYYLTEGYIETGGTNLVNTILVDFRALDTLGELTILGVVGLTIAALLRARKPSPERSANIQDHSPLIDARDNTVFVRTAAKLLAPIIVAGSLVLLLRGHYEPGGGFIAALVGGAGFALAYLAAPSDRSARVQMPYLLLIGLGVAVGVGTGFLGYLDGSFLRPLHPEIFEYQTTTALVFDVGVYLAVIGVILASFNLLGRPHANTPATTPTTPRNSDEVNTR